MSNNELKNLAFIAKQRLKNANYSDKNKINYNKNSYFIKNISAMKKLTGNAEYITISDVEDAQFLKKVYSILSSSEEIFNPIAQLMDENYFKTLNDIEKQSYVLKITDRYNKAKENYLSGKNIRIS